MQVCVKKKNVERLINSHYAEVFVFFSIKISQYRLLGYAEQEMLTLPGHLISPLVFIEVRVVLSFVSPYFML